MSTDGKTWSWDDAAPGRAIVAELQRARHDRGEVLGKPFATKHGWGGTPTYNSWKKMRHRCLYPTCKDYPNYGGRGITICDRWINDVNAFVEDMGERPPGGYSLERVDVFGNYEPSNCVWLLHRLQGYNKRNTIK